MPDFVHVNSDLMFDVRKLVKLHQTIFLLKYRYIHTLFTFMGHSKFVNFLTLPLIYTREQLPDIKKEVFPPSY